MDLHNERIRHGMQVFQQHCYRCHPGGEAGVGTEVVHKPGFLQRLQTRHGFGPMPAFKKNEISKRELDDMIVYLKQLRRLR